MVRILGRAEFWEKIAEPQSLQKYVDSTFPLSAVRSRTIGSPDTISTVSAAT
jgi:hypothetical protein